MYLLQVRNTLSDEILLQQSYENPYAIENLIESAKDWREWFIYDDQKRALKGYYVDHSIIHDGDNIIYKVYFTAKLAKLSKDELTGLGV